MSLVFHVNFHHFWFLDAVCETSHCYIILLTAGKKAVFSINHAHRTLLTNHTTVAVGSWVSYFQNSNLHETEA